MGFLKRVMPQINRTSQKLDPVLRITRIFFFGKFEPEKDFIRIFLKALVWKTNRNSKSRRPHLSTPLTLSPALALGVTDAIAPRGSHTPPTSPCRSERRRHEATIGRPHPGYISPVRPQTLTLAPPFPISAGTLPPRSASRPANALGEAQAIATPSRPSSSREDGLNTGISRSP